MKYLNLKYLSYSLSYDINPNNKYILFISTIGLNDIYTYSYEITFNNNENNLSNIINKFIKIEDSCQTYHFKIFEFSCKRVRLLYSNIVYINEFDDYINNHIKLNPMFDDIFIETKYNGVLSLLNECFYNIDPIYDEKSFDKNEYVIVTITKFNDVQIKSKFIINPKIINTSGKLFIYNKYKHALYLKSVENNYLYFINA